MRLNANVLVIGDAILDRYVVGSVNRTSPEAPVPVLKMDDATLVPGGAANVAMKAAELGQEAKLITVLGQDPEGRCLIDQLAGVRIAGCISTARRPTTFKSRFMAQGQQLLRVDREVCSDIDSMLEQPLIRDIKDAMERADVVIIQDYGKGVVTKSVVQETAAAASARGIPVLVDPCLGSNPNKYCGCHAIKPNIQEIENMVGREAKDDADFYMLAKSVLECTGMECVYVTRGAAGITVCKRGASSVTVGTKSYEVFDVTGAGDAVAVVLALAMANKLDPEEAARLANLAGGIIVGQLGNGHLSWEAMEARASGHGLVFGCTGKLLTVLNIERTPGRTVVFTNGIFDLLHYGHVRMLEDCKKQGDLLVVGVNDDASVRRLKGSERPIIPEHERARVIGSLGCVDYVTLFSEDTPLSVIEALKPDVLCKGADYQKEEIVGWDVVEGYGGRVCRIPLVEGLGTTELVSKIREEVG